MERSIRPMARLRSTSVPRGILFHTAVWPQETWAESLVASTSQIQFTLQTCKATVYTKLTNCKRNKTYLYCHSNPSKNIHKPHVGINKILRFQSKTRQPPFHQRISLITKHRIRPKSFSAFGPRRIEYNTVRGDMNTTEIIGRLLNNLN